MGTPVQVTPLSGAYGEGALCYLLIVDGFCFLLNCGWTDLYDTSQLEPLAKKVTLIINKEELDKLGDAPKVVLASMASLEVGFSHDIFVDMANEARNLVLFTEKGQLGTLAHMLQMDPPPRAVKVTMSNQIPLVGDELKAYEEEQVLVHIAPACVGSGEGSVFFVSSLSLHFCKRLLPGLEPVTSWSQGNSFTAAPGLPFYEQEQVRIKKEEMLKARLVKEGELKDSHGLNAKAFDPVVIDGSSSRKSSNAGSRLGGNMDILIHGFVPPSTSVAPRFPLFENTAEWDDFGSYVRLFLQGSREGLDAKIDEGLACLLLDSTPSKIISNEMTVHVKCSLIYMDFEGRSDARSIKSVIAHMAPQKLVLVHGSTEATEHLKMHCANNSNLHVYAPKIEETIDVTSDISAYKVQLSENLMSHVMPKKIGELEIAWLDAEVEKEDQKLILNPPSSTAPPRRPVLVGEN